MGFALLLLLVVSMERYQESGEDWDRRGSGVGNSGNVIRNKATYLWSILS